MVVIRIVLIGGLCLSLLGITCLYVQAQIDSVTTDEVFETVELPPRFPGGQGQWHAYLQKNLRYPPAAQKAGIEEVVVNFVVTRLSEIQHAHALTHPRKVYNPGLVWEAERLIRAMPTWEPAKVAGRPVSCQFNVPVKFTLD